MTPEKPAPRDLARVPESFGRGDTDWVDDPALNPLVAAAALQSAIADVARSGMWARAWSLVRLARESDLSVDRVGRSLRGEQWMDLADAVALGRAVGMDLVKVRERAPRQAEAWLGDSDLTSS